MGTQQLPPHRRKHVTSPVKSKQAEELLSKVLSFLFIYLRALWIITLLFVISTNENVHASPHAMISLDKVHMVRARTHALTLTHTYTLILHKKTTVAGPWKGGCAYGLDKWYMARWG